MRISDWSSDVCSSDLLRALHETDERDEAQRDDDDSDDDQRRHSPGAALLEQADDRRRQMRDDARHDDQRNAVADTPAGDLLAKPHQEHGAADQRRHARDAEHQADRKSKRMNSSHYCASRMQSS